jgi:hypothetical protein
MFFLVAVADQPQRHLRTNPFVDRVTSISGER